MNIISELWKDATGQGYSSDWVVILISWLILIMIALLASVVIYGCYRVADVAFIEDNPAIGEVCGRNHTGAWTQTTFVNSGNVQVPIITHHPESWNIYVKYKDSVGSFSVTQDRYDSYFDGMRVNINYRIGRISGKIRITSAGL